MSIWRTPPAREAVALAALDEGERVRWSRFQYPGPRRRFALCRAALRDVLCRQLGCDNSELEFETSKYGKPSALVNQAPAPFSFNVSHSGNHGLIAFAPEGRIGVDIEERVTHRKLELLVESVFGKEERAELARMDGRDKINLFFKLWTMKEAIAKAHGAGFVLDVSSFDMRFALRGDVPRADFRLPQSPEVCWRIEDLGNTQFAAAIAFEVLGENTPRRSAA